VKETVLDWLRNQLNTFFTSGTETLAGRWVKRIEKKILYREIMFFQSLQHKDFLK